MYEANTDFIQATIEIFGMIICLVGAALISIVTERRNKSEKAITWVVIVTAISLLVDAGWHIIDGKTTMLAIGINRLCSFVAFCCNPLQIALASLFLINVSKENGQDKKKWVQYIPVWLSVASLGIVFSNFFIKWMYAFDEQNVYYRLIGWYIYSVVLLTALLALGIVAAISGKTISLRKRLTLCLFVLLPIIGAVLQTLTMGISYIQLGASLGILLVAINYIGEWIYHENNKKTISTEKRSFWVIEGIFLVMILCISAAIISCILSVNSVSAKNSKQNSFVIGHMVSETIENSMYEPVVVSRTMAQSDIIRDAVSLHTLVGTYAENKMVDYLTSISEEYGYQMVFVASDITKAYYRYDGLSRYMDVDNDPDDAWYNEFKYSGKRYELNIDYDKDNNMERAIFVNMEILDDDGNFIGVCGVGMSIEKLILALSEYEEKYELNIAITNLDGLVQVTPNRDLIEEEYLEFKKPVMGSDEEFSYTKAKQSARLTKYMDTLGWYLVIDDNNPNKLNVFQIVLPSMIIYIVGVMLMAIFIWMYNRYEKRRNEELMANRRLSEIDELTGMYNRNAFENAMAELKEHELSDGLAIILMDINGLKTVNDTIGHSAGDELIVGAADCIKAGFNEIGKAYRIGGDEFVIIADCDELTLNAKIRIFLEDVKNWRGQMIYELSASIGVAEHSKYPELDAAELEKEADKLMYLNKNEYYRRSGKDRRMTW